MYISLLTLSIIAAIVVFCWFRKPAKTIAESTSEVVQTSADILHAGLSQLRDQVEVANMTSSVKNTLEVMTLLQEHKTLVEKGITVHSLYQGFMASKADLTVGEKGRPLTDIQRKAVLRKQFMDVLNGLAPAAQPEPQSSVKPAEANPEAEVFTL